MIRNLPLFALTAAALVSGAAGVASAATTTQVHSRTVVAHTAASKPAMVRAAAKPAAAPGRMVTAKTASGKTVTYNCSKAGNAAKKACK